ncbi:hypothetical protein LCGC14_1902670 [marine sediment metagenome]|uniref:Semialdehyde dehydrogenase NAD-binding domain-containing protein n=1 Tax=marine sediment metagenome TaxID=412755 RepID=A0A0F9FW47_9ZZZZ
MTHKIAILGASGYTGAELVRLIATHPEMDIVALSADRKAGQSMASVFPHLRHLDLPMLVTIDQIALEVLRNQTSSIAEDMGVVLSMTAFSPNIKERADCSAAIFTPDGEMLAQAEHIPVHLGSMPASVAAMIERFGTEPEPGIQYAVNDPFHGGTHLNDLTLDRHA